MLTPFLSLALAGTLVVDANVPTEVRVDGRLIVEIYEAGVFRTDVPAGSHEVVVYLSGEGTRQSLLLPEQGEVVVGVGRTGVSWPAAARSAVAVAAPDGPGSVSFRSVAREDVVVTVGRARHLVPAGGTLDLELAAGDHAVSVRSGDGTVVWARGHLTVTGPGLIVQLNDGRMPETLGEGGRFTPDGG
jgi:hypothetical protein